MQHAIARSVRQRHPLTRQRRGTAASVEEEREREQGEMHAEHLHLHESSSFHRSSACVGSIGYWAQQVLWAVATSCPDCSCKCHCGASQRPGNASERVEVVLSLQALVERQPEKVALALVVFCALLGCVYIAGARRGASRVAEPFIPSPIYEVTTVVRRKHAGGGGSPSRAARALKADVAGRLTVLDPIQW